MACQGLHITDPLPDSPVSNDYLDDWFMSNGACLRLALRESDRGDFGTHMRSVPMGDPLFSPDK